MSKEIVEAVRGLAAEKNISFDKLIEALEDALLSAYKKTPGSAPYATVEVDREEGEFIKHIDDAAKAHAPTATEESSDDEKVRAPIFFWARG